MRKTGVFGLALIIVLLLSQVNVSAGDTIYTPGRFSFYWANDFPYKTDYYYSNGLQFSLDAAFMKRSPFNIFMLPDFDDSQRWFGIRLSHAFFTPQDIYSEEIEVGDRPYAAVLMIGNRKISQSKIRRINIFSEIAIGIMGEYAGGKQIQNGIHDVLWTSRPAGGWLNQQASELCLSYNAGISKGVSKLDYLAVDLGVNTSIGLPITNISPHLQLSIGKFNDPYLNRGMQKNTWQGYLSFSMNGSMVFYNATIQGGLINKSSPYTLDIEPFVYGYSTGINVSYNLIKLAIQHHWTSPELTGGKDHRWADMTLSIGF